MDRYEGLREFFEARCDALARTAFLLTGDVGSAEDLLQDAMTRTIARWGKATASANPEAYVRKVMLNEVRSRWRRRKRRVSEHVAAQLDEQPSPLNIESATIERTMLAGALRGIAPRQRAVLYLRFYEDLSEIETAEVLGCSVGTVKSQTHDALRNLRTKAPELLDADAVEVTND